MDSLIGGNLKMAAPTKRANREEMTVLRGKECTKQLKDQTKAVINDRRNANQLIDIILCCEVTDCVYHNVPKNAFCCVS